MKNKLLVLVLLVALILTACTHKQGQNGNNKDETTTESSVENVKIKDLTCEVEVGKILKKLQHLIIGLLKPLKIGELNWLRLQKQLCLQLVVQNR